jgi:hypothetical protein
MLLDLTCIVLSTMLGVARPASVPTVARAQMDSMPLLTTDMLARMTTFWQTFMKEPDSIRTKGRAANREEITVSLGGQPVAIPSVVDMTAMAAKYPSVVADFKTAGLTPQQWDGYRQALFSGMMSQGSPTSDVEPPRDCRRARYVSVASAAWGS